MTTTTVISFRAHRNLESWLELAGPAFESEGELLRLIVTKAAVEQARDAGVVGTVLGLFSRGRARDVGDTIVYAARLPATVAELVKANATRRGVTVSEWCAVALQDWYRVFSDSDRADGLVEYAADYRDLVHRLYGVYAEKHPKQAAESGVE